MINLDERQEKFCRLVAISGYSWIKAAELAGFAPSGGTTKSWATSAERAKNSPKINRRVAELRESVMDVTAVRKDTLLWYLKAVDLCIPDYVDSIEETMENGKKYNRVRLVKPVESWDSVTKSLVIGYDKSGTPLFIDKRVALESIRKMMGLDKENSVSNEQDFNSILEDAGVKNESIELNSEDDSFDDEDDFDCDFVEEVDTEVKTGTSMPNNCSVVLDDSIESQCDDCDEPYSYDDYEIDDSDDDGEDYNYDDYELEDDDEEPTEGIIDNTGFGNEDSIPTESDGIGVDDSGI